MKTILLTILLIAGFYSGLYAQTSNFKEIDQLIATNSMIDALTALQKLKEQESKEALKPEYWLRHSKASYIVYKYADAKSSIDKAIELSPGRSALYFEKGLLYNKIGELDPALAAFEKAVSIDKIGEYFYWKGIVNQNLKSYEKALMDYDKAISYKFESRELYNNYAIILLEGDNYEKALPMINKAIAIDNEYSEAISARSQIHFYLLNIDAACIDRARAMELGYRRTFQIDDTACNGTPIQRLEYAAGVFAFTKSYKRAIAAYSRLIESDVLKFDYFLNRGYCYFKLADYSNAEKDYVKALAYESSFKDLLYDNLSLLYYDQNNFLKSIEYASMRIKLNPKNHVPYIDRGLCYRKLKRYKEAEKDFNKSLEIKPDFFRAFGYRSFLYLELGQYQKSYDDALKSVSINPQYGYGYMMLAQAKQQLGMPDFCLDYYTAKKYGAPDAELGIEKNCNK